jgi:uncharacterized protein
MKRTFLTAEWRKLAIANYSIDPDILAPYLPYKTELDYWKNKCYISLVGFRFINTKLRGIKIPFHRNFEEINLRFYVRFKEEGAWKRGVCFIKEIVPKPALTLIANSIYNENYVTLPTKHIFKSDGASIQIAYSWKYENKWDTFCVGAKSMPLEIVPGSEEEFITEHYWGYTQVGKEISSQYEVQHPRWEIYPVTEYQINVRFGGLYGAAFSKLKDTLPDSIMLAEGSRISVLSSSKIY